MFLSIKDRADRIFRLLRSDTETNYYSTLLIVIVVLILGAIIAHYITYGFSIKLLICLLVLFFYLLLYRMKMISAFKLSSELSNYETKEGENTKEYYSGYLNFLESGIEIKKTRVNYIRNLYMLVFPLFLYMFVEVIKGEYQSKDILILLVIAYLISFLAWKYFFNEDLEEWTSLEEEIKDLKNQVHLK